MSDTPPSPASSSVGQRRVVRRLPPLHALRHLRLPDQPTSLDEALHRSASSLWVPMLIGSAALGVGWMVMFPDRWLDGLLTASVLLGASITAGRSPQHLPTLLIAVYTFNRLVRRWLDWSAGEFSSTPIVSLLPPLLALMMGVIGIQSFLRWPRAARLALQFLAAAMVLALAVGIRQKLAAVLEFVTWASPLGVLAFVLWLRPTLAEVRSWILTLVVCAVLAVGYGWIQFTLLPEWDRFWMIHADMGSLEIPEPFKCRFFGPAGGPGQLAYLIVITIPLVGASRVLRPPINVIVILFLGMGLLMTMARTALAALVLIILLYTFFGKLQEKLRVVMLATLAIVAFVAVLPALPNGHRVIQRVNSFTSLGSDGSAQGRLAFSREIIRHVAYTPLGHGFGSVGASSRMRDGGSISAFDNGFLQFPYTLGWGGTILFWWGLWLLWRQSREAVHLKGEAGSLMRMQQSVCLGMVVALISSNWFDAPFAVFFWLLLGVGVAWSRVQVRPAPALAPRSSFVPRRARLARHRETNA